jgi:hypothetical protein
MASPSQSSPALRGSCLPSGVSRTAINKSLFPCSAPSASISIHDLTYHQNLLQNQHNYAAETSCDVFEIDSAGVGQWRRGLDDSSLGEYLMVEITSSWHYYGTDHSIY